VEKSKEAIDECKENLSTLESKYSKLQATQEMVREEEGERSKLANSIADAYAMDKGLVVSSRHRVHVAASLSRTLRVCEHTAIAGA
jgi:hypothetical protein